METKELININSKELDKMTDKEALDLWNKKNTTPKSKTNYIYLDNRLSVDGESNPEFGKITAHSFDSEGNETVEEIKVGDSFYPIIERVQIKSKNFVEHDGGLRPKYSIGETKDTNEIVVHEGNKIVFTGPYSEAKELFDLKYAKAVYVFLKKKVYRWELKGTTVRSWFNLTDTLYSCGKPKYVTIDSIEKEKNGNIVWNTVHFKEGKDFPVKPALQLQLKLENELDRRDVENLEKDTKKIFEVNTTTYEQ